jgi:hypothetical protein
MKRVFFMALLLIVASGCVRREGLNTECRWPQEGLAPLEPGNDAHFRHLSADAQFAEELGIRYGDSFHGKETVEERGRRVEDCTARLMTYLSMLHSVPLDEVERARAHREIRVDIAAVFVPMAAIFGMVAYAVAGRVQRRLHSGTPLVVGLALVSLVVALAGVMVGELWSWMVEIIRVGNGHLSYRAFRLPWTQHRTVIFAAGVGMFLVLAFIRTHITRAPAPDRA